MLACQGCVCTVEAHLLGMSKLKGQAEEASSRGKSQANEQCPMGKLKGQAQAMLYLQQCLCDLHEEAREADCIAVRPGRGSR